MLKVHVHVQQSKVFCTYEGTTGRTYRAVVVTPYRLTAANRPGPYVPRDGRIVTIAGTGYHGQAQNNPTSTTAAGLEQSKAQIFGGDVAVGLLVTYQGTALRGVLQLSEAAKLADLVGKRLGRSR